MCLERPFFSDSTIGERKQVEQAFGVPVKWRAMAFIARGHGKRGSINRGCNVELMEEIRRLQTRLEALELNKQRDPDVGDISGNEDEPKEERGAEVEHEEVELLKYVIGASLRPKP